MTAAPSPVSTPTSRGIKASREAIYRAFTDPNILTAWLVPVISPGTIHEFDARVGGGYRDTRLLMIAQKF